MKTCLYGSCALIEGNMILLKHDDKLGKWMFPGDHESGNEDPKMAALRAIKEISGMDCIIVDYNTPENEGKADEMSDLKPITILMENLTYEDGPHRHYDLIFLGTPNGKSKSIIKKKNDDVKWFPVENLPEDMFENVKSIVNRGWSYLYSITKDGDSGS